jgi:hypothetical protein
MKCIYTSLFDLLNDTDIAPQDVDREVLEKSLFDQPDPYDLDETNRVNAVEARAIRHPRRGKAEVRVRRGGEMSDRSPSSEVSIERKVE